MKSLLTVISPQHIFQHAMSEAKAFCLWRRAAKFSFIALLSCICLLLPARADGVSLDPTFGSGGVLTTNVLNNDFGSQVLIQPDGKIIVVGHQYAPGGGGGGVPRSPLMIRYNANGTLDATFGNGGKVLVSTSYAQAAAFSGSLQPDGKIVLVGQTISPPFQSQPSEFLIMRFNSNGSFDTSFNGSGISAIDAGSLDVALQVVLQPDGKILVAGYMWIAGPHATAIIRLNSDGSLDTGFGTSGKRNFFDTEDGTHALGLTLQADGKIVLVEGSFSTYTGGGVPHNFRLRRLKSDGTNDPSFGTNGVVFHDFGSNEGATSVVALADGKLLVGGANEADFLLARFNENGTLDTTFGTNGKTTTDFLGFSDYLSDLKVLSDGRIVAVGSATYSLTISRFAVAVYNASGSLTEILTTIINTGDTASSVEAQADGKLVVAGTTSYDNLGTRLYDVAVARYQLNTSVPRTVLFDFDGDGKSDVSIYRADTENASSLSYWHIIRSSDNQLLVPQFGNGQDLFVPADYNGDGRTDLAVFRPAQGNWYFTSDLLNSQTNFQSFHWGQNGDRPAPGDYDGDGRADLAVYRPSQSAWHIRLSSNGSLLTRQFGIATDVPVQADYDGDGKTDIAVLRQSGGNLFWYILQSSDNGFVAEQFGAVGDRAVAADYNGDGKADIAVWRPATGTWYTSLNPNINYGAFHWGQNGDIPAPADYDGDGKTDFTIYRPANGVFYILRSTNGTLTFTQLGNSTDLPVASAYVR